MEEAWLSSRLESGRWIESIAREAGRPASTVAYWIGKHSLVSRHARRHAARGGVDRERLDALVEQGLSVRAIAGELGVSFTTVRYWLKRFGLATQRSRRRTVKAMLVAEAGGGCVLCGYDRHPRALHFHHLDPTEKAFGLAFAGVARSLERSREEARKCVLLCSNCHAEVEDGIATIPGAVLERVRGSSVGGSSIGRAPPC